MYFEVSLTLQMHKRRKNELWDKLQTNSACEISGSHGGEYEVQSLLGCTAV
jgi:hypothetical protein